MSYTPYASNFVPCSARFISCGITPKAKGILNIYEMSKGSLDDLGSYILPHGIKCATFNASSIEDRHVAFGDYGGQLSVSSLENPEAPIFNVQVS